MGKPKSTPAGDEQEPLADAQPESPMEMVEFDFRGESFVIPKDRDDWDTEAFLAIARGDIYVALQLILGPDQWLKLRRIGTSRRVAKEFSSTFSDVAARECVN